MTDETSDTGPEPAPDPDAAAIDALLALVSEIGWRRIDLAHVTVRAGLDEAALYRRFADKAGIVNAYSRSIDLAACAGYETPAAGADEDTIYDRLLDILMQRFEAMEPQRVAVRGLARALPCDPVAMLTVMPQMRRSMARMAAAAGLPVRGLRGSVAGKALAGVWLATQQVWFADDSPDLARTMSALDRNLRRAWPLLRGGPSLRRGRPAGPPPGHPADDPLRSA